MALNLTAAPPAFAAAAAAAAPAGFSARALMRLLGALLVACVLMAFSFDAEARRMGGGKSIGRQSSNVTQRQATNPPPAAPGQQQAAGTRGGAQQGAAGAGRRPWGGILGGLAAGLGLAWLAHSLGMGEGFANLLTLLLLGMAAFALLSYLRRPRQSASAAAGMQGMAYQGAGMGGSAHARSTRPASGAHAGGGSIIGSAIAGAGGAAAAGASPLAGPQGWGIPAGFDVAGFTEAARRNFISLQAAWDKADVPALRAMMTDALLAEIQRELVEREREQPGQPHHTQVLDLQAELLGIEELDDAYMASVEFTGLVAEDGAAPAPLREVWNMTKPRHGRGGWLVAGLQQVE